MHSDRWQAFRGGAKQQEHYAAALTIYEVLITEVIEHFNDYRDEYVSFSVILMGCIDGLDSCFAGEEHNPEMRLRVIRVLFAIYRFYTGSWMDLKEELDAKGNQSVGDVPTQNIYGFSPRIAENGSHHKGE